jgi:predicted nuclease of predicted toxin-antitoxin system
MNLTFFSDHCVPTEVVEALVRAGHKVVQLREVLPSHSPDPEVIGKAQRLDALLVSLNGDFSDIVRYAPQKYGGIFALQLHNPRGYPILDGAHECVSAGALRTRVLPREVVSRRTPSHSRKAVKGSDCWAANRHSPFIVATFGL